MNWIHKITMLDGSITPGIWSTSPSDQEHFMFPESFDGKSVLDVGTLDGYWAVEAKKRGASDVMAIDVYDLPREEAKLACSSFGVKYKSSWDIFNFEHPRLEYLSTYDYVLCFGVVYHTLNPIAVLENCKKVCVDGGYVLVESAVCQGKASNLDESIPAIWVVDERYEQPGTEDLSNRMIPNVSGLIQMCKYAGLEIIKHKLHPSGKRCGIICANLK